MIMNFVTITLTALISFIINDSTQLVNDISTDCQASMNWHNIPPLSGT